MTTGTCLDNEALSSSGKAKKPISLAYQGLKVSTGVASLVTLPSAYSTAQAQDATATPLPELVVEGQAPKKKAAKPKKPSPAPVYEPAEVMPAPAVTNASEGGNSTFALTPASGNTSQAGTGIGRLPGTVQDVPKIVNVVPQQILEQQGIQSLERALQNVPGVTVAIGEGGPPNGDQFRIRGIEARGDIYTDGLRDFGIFTRDAFNYESVQVLKGPSSGTFGQGTAGGAINTQSKTARLDTFSSGAVSLGSGSLKRTTVDGNYQLNETSAIRINGMFQDDENPDRDLIESNRWGVAASLGLGLGTNTELVVNYFHQKEDRVPDYGIPGVLRPGSTVGQPLSEYGVPRSNFYGFDTDTDKTQVDALTAKFKHTFNPFFTVYNDTRVTGYDRTFAATQANCQRSGTVPTACSDSFFTTGDYNGVTRGGPSPYELDGWAFQNVTSAVAKFNTGMFRHELVAGVDYVRESNERQGYSYSPGRPDGTIVDPSHASPFRWKLGTKRESDSRNLGLFVSDRLWLTPQLSVVGGVRWDDFEAETNNGGTITKTDNEMTNPNASVIWEPVPNQNLYFSWARAQSPQGSYITGESVSSSVLEPEEAETFEVGTKLNFLNGKLGFTGAIFKVTKDNAYGIDPDSGLINDSRGRGESYEIRGVELGVTGRILPDVTIFGGYTYLDTQIVDNGQGEPNVGNQMWLVPEHAASLWATYDASDWLLRPAGLTGEWLWGAGVRYQSEIFLNSDNSLKVPSSFTFDAMTSYEFNNYKITLNGYNLTDELNYDQLWTSRAVPSKGRTFTVTGAVKF
ncbi:catecholate siderophore receptor [Filomicrobium insigne]|uniref:TonB-dependent siderophore receptor n=2 Tax=Filomicrobium TaxID=119044 RepID=A0A0D6JBY9_9HYPH|nr:MULTISPECIES: TonB-dependent siderophore receptor [Filomicrobium]CPR16818.1 TonB-dependent siderophore receptor [Candidatus Filomicrobium marinum]SDO44480.1 catecholate siderophore receptor [Filomicrobium insigne]